CAFVAALSAGYLAAGAISNLGLAEPRPLVLLGLMTALSMIVSARSRMRMMIPSLVAATILAMATVYSWRHWVDPSAAIGPAPPPLEFAALAAIGALNIVAGVVVAVVFSARSSVFRWRWLVFAASGAALFAFCVLASRWAEDGNSAYGLLQ